MRKTSVHRKTMETDINLSLCLDGTGNHDIHTGIGFFDHMLTLLSAHSSFDLDIKAKGDLHIDTHHCVEDVGICLGQAFRISLGECKGIYRYSAGLFPMDEALTQIAVDISNRPSLIFKHPMEKVKIGEFDTELCHEFLNAFVSHARITLHIHILYGENHHHMVESCFKGLGRTLGQACAQDPKRQDSIPSTKGVL